MDYDHCSIKGSQKTCLHTHQPHFQSPYFISAAHTHTLTHPSPFHYTIQLLNSFQFHSHTPKNRTIDDHLNEKVEDQKKAETTCTRKKEKSRNSISVRNLSHFLIKLISLFYAFNCFSYNLNSVSKFKCGFKSVKIGA